MEKTSSIKASELMTRFISTKGNEISILLEDMEYTVEQGSSALEFITSASERVVLQFADQACAFDIQIVSDDEE